ncbi:MAG: LarC family nickel insertion protein [Candidatus Ornithomonoglobus sp.]
MDTLYIDSRMGVSGEKLFAALVDMLDAPEAFIRRFNELGMNGIRIERSTDARKGIAGSIIEFRRHSENANMYDDELDEKQPHPHRHRTVASRKLGEIKEIIDDLPLTGKVRKQASAIYDSIAQAAAKAYGKDPQTLSLHRTGGRDVIASVIGVCMLLEELEYDQILASPIAVGTGYAETSRGRLPIPIPPLQLLLDGIPFSNGSEEGEICTLEGAAILKYFADSFEDMPELTIKRTGNGLGQREFKSGVNCVRVYLGKVVKSAANKAVAVLEAVLYNDNAQSLLLASERLEETGVTEAYTIPVASLTGGSGFVLRCVCPADIADKAAGEILRNTSARSVRRISAAAYETEQTVTTISTSIGEIGMIKTNGFGVSDVRPVSADVANAAREHGITYAEALEIINKEV